MAKRFVTIILFFLHVASHQKLRSPAPVPQCPRWIEINRSQLQQLLRNTFRKVTDLNPGSHEVGRGRRLGPKKKQPESGAENEAVKAKIEPDRATNQKVLNF